MRALLRVAVLLVVLPACAPVVQYTDEIVDSSTGRSWLVTVPATVGGFCGFVAGIPADIVALPVTFSMYRLQDPDNADPVSTLLFPSFALWRAGTLIGSPMDLVDYGLFRAWRPPATPTADEQNELEYQFDMNTLPRYPVETLLGAAPR